MKLNQEKIKTIFLVISWSLYDLANQFFALNVVSLYFVRWLTLEKNIPEIFYSLSFSISTFFIATFSPLLGALADITQRHKPFLVYLTLLSIVFTMLLSLSDNVSLNLLFFGIANFGCQLAIVFYNALMVGIAPREKSGLVSGIGRAFGYSGAILALYLIKPIVLKKGFRGAFFPSGFFFLLFSLPCLIFIKDKSPQDKINPIHFLKKEKIAGIFKELWRTAFNAPELTGLADFLKASFFSLCAVNAVILFMSVYATKVFSLSESQIINLVAFSTLFAIAGSIFSGMFSDYLGYKNYLIAVFILWNICFLSGALARSTHLYWIVGALVGIALGSTWVVARALITRLVPRKNMGEVFGLFNLVGYLSSIIGALFWGVILHLLSGWGELAYRITLLSLCFFITVGFIFLLRIPKEKREELCQKRV